jgi:hypothetical protein
MKVDGGCLCGEIKYEAEVDPMRVALCHCTDCQVTSGTAMNWVALVVDAHFELTRGSIRLYVKTSDSGRRRALGFCPECGSRILSKPVDGEPGYIALRVGSIRQRDRLPPRAHLWARSAQPWIDELGQLPRVEQQP